MEHDPATRAGAEALIAEYDRWPTLRGEWDRLLAALRASLTREDALCGERDEARGRCREAASVLVAAIGADGPQNVDDLARRAAAELERLTTAQTALENVRMLALRLRRTDPENAEHFLRFCRSAGVTGSVLRGDTPGTQVLTGDDATRLAESLDNACSPEEFAARRRGAREFLAHHRDAAASDGRDNKILSACMCDGCPACDLSNVRLAHDLCDRDAVPGSERCPECTT